MTWQIPALKSAETQEHLEVSSGLKATCCFPLDIIESEQAVFTIQKQSYVSCQCQICYLGHIVKPWPVL